MSVHRIDEIVPNEPLHAEVVLHVRRLLRSRIRRKDRAAEALALLFGFASESADPAWTPAARAADPVAAGAAVAARLRRTGDGVVPLGFDADHVDRCHALLRQRKDLDEAFRPIIATDLGTLLELSKAREMAQAEGLDDDGEPRPLPVFIRGETGTGKELLARAIHEISGGGTKKPYVVIHVAGMTNDMINAEIFGHTKGAFTDAKTERAGRLEEADGGTVLIDEVGDLPDAAQLRLLRFLQTQRMSKLGENRERKLRVRVIAATWHDLDKDVTSGRFRQDLLYRLRVGAELVLPPLRDRPRVFDEVVPEILRRRGHQATPLLARSTQDALALHTWQGNLRELVGVLEQTLAVAEGETLRVEHLPSAFQRAYLSLPLHRRAAGFLSDEVGGQALDADHVAWRAEEVARSLQALPPPDANPEIEMVTRFLSVLDDSSAEHEQTRATVSAFADLEREARRSAQIADTWRTILALDLPPLVHAEVNRRLEKALERAQQIASNVSEAQESLHLDRHPWLALLKEAMESPLLAQADRNAVVTSFLAIFSLVKAVAPKALEEARAALKKGGFAALRDRIAEAVGDEGKGPHELAKLPHRPPGSLSRDDWVEIARLPTQANAITKTGYDPKTIAKYLAHHGIASPWKRPS